MEVIFSIGAMELMMGTGSAEVTIILMSLLYLIIPIAIAIWLIVSIQSIKKSVRNIEHNIRAQY